MSLGILTTTLTVDGPLKRGQWQGALALGELVDMRVLGVAGTDPEGLTLTLRDPAPPVAPRGQATPAAGHVVAACAVWSQIGHEALTGRLDLRTAEMIRAFREWPKVRVLEFALRNSLEGELLAAGMVTVQGNADYLADPEGFAAAQVQSGLERDFVTGGDAHIHDGEGTARVSHYHLLDAGELTHAQLEAGLEAVGGEARAATHAAGAAAQVAEGAAARAGEALEIAGSAQEEAAAAQVAAAVAVNTANGAEALANSLARSLEGLDAQNTHEHRLLNTRMTTVEAKASNAEYIAGQTAGDLAQFEGSNAAEHGVINGRLDALEALAGQNRDEIARLESLYDAQIRALQTRLGVIETLIQTLVGEDNVELAGRLIALEADVAALKWRSLRVSNAEGTQWARIYAVEAAGRRALGPLGEMEVELHGVP